MRQIDKYLKIKWESAIRLEDAFDRLNKIKVDYFTTWFIDLPQIPKDHPDALRITENLNKTYKRIVETEAELNALAKNVQKMHMLIDVYKRCKERKKSKR